MFHNYVKLRHLNESNDDSNFLPFRMNVQKQTKRMRREASAYVIWEQIKKKSSENTQVT